MYTQLVHCAIAHYYRSSHLELNSVVFSTIISGRKTRCVGTVSFAEARCLLSLIVSCGQLACEITDADVAGMVEH